jgi:RHS repeat-associated protein
VLTRTINYSYDALDRRVNKEIIESGVTTDETYAYDGQHIKLRFQDGDLVNHYVHGERIDQIFADDVIDPVTGIGEAYWMLTDNLGTVEAIVDYDGTTDASSIVNEITYDAFGEIESETNASAVDHIFGYTGRERDNESSLNYYRARYYDTDTGRFISQDPISFAAGDTNLYRYVGNGATTKTDPSGL